MWFFAIVSGVVLASVRLVGIMIIPALLMEFITQRSWKINKIKNINLNSSDLFILIGILLIPIGQVLYAFFNQLKWGDYFYFIKAHGELANGRSVNSIIFFPQTIYRYVKILTTIPFSQYEWWVASWEITTFFIGGYLLYLAFKNKIRDSYLVFSSLAFLLPASSGTFTGLPRYLAILFPVFMVLGVRQKRKLSKIYILSAVILFLLTLFFTRGYFVA